MATLSITAQAADQIEAAASWWAANRTAAPLLFVTELRRTFELITGQPGIGAPATDVALDRVRRILIGRSRYLVYYQYDGNTVQVLAVWHGSRGASPPLSSPA